MTGGPALSKRNKTPKQPAYRDPPIRSLLALGLHAPLGALAQPAQNGEPRMLIARLHQGSADTTARKSASSQNPLQIARLLLEDPLEIPPFPLPPNDAPVTRLTLAP